MAVTEFENCIRSDERPALHRQVDAPSRHEELQFQVVDRALEPRLKLGYHG